MKLSYTLDAAGRRTQIVEDASGVYVATTNFTYDGAGRLTSEKRITDNAYWYVYTYDGAGNRTKRESKNTGGTVTETTNYTYDSGNKLTSEAIDGGSTTTYSYDENGNQVEVVNSSPSATVTYDWNYEDKLKDLGGVVSVPEFKTDAEGFRRSKTVGAVVTKFLYDLGQIQTPGLAPVVAEYNGSGVLQAKYHSGAVGLLGMRRSSTTYWYLCDALGSVRKLANTSGTVTDSYLQDAWGNLITSSGSTVNPFRYVGRENYYSDPDDLPDLLLLGVRYYSLSLGRFVTPDPIGLRGGDYNLYRYVKDGPMNVTDPRGLWDASTVHGRCTRLWARETYVLYRGNYRMLKYPDTIGAGCQATDNFYNSAANPAKWHNHFNYQSGRGDYARVYNGYPLDRTPDARETFFLQQKIAALMQTDCSEVSYQFGLGLHAIQDESSHMDLTPAEHVDASNWPYVDNPDYIRRNQIGNTRPIIAPHDPLGMLGFAGLASLFAQLPDVRVFYWDRVGRTSWFSRTLDLENRTRTELQKFLSLLSSNYYLKHCTKCVPKSNLPSPVTRCP